MPSCQSPVLQYLRKSRHLQDASSQGDSQPMQLGKAQVRLHAPVMQRIPIRLVGECRPLPIHSSTHEQDTIDLMSPCAHHDNPSSRPKRRNVATMILASLVLGVLTTLALAIVPAALVDFPGFQCPLPDTPVGPDDAFPYWHITRGHEWRAPRPEDWPSRSLWEASLRSTFVHEYRAIAYDDSSGPEHSICQQRVISAGWPLPSLMAYCNTSGREGAATSWPAQFQMQAGIAVPEFIGSPISGIERRIPLWPSLPGFGMGVLLWGLVALCVLIGLDWSVHTLRVRRGRCGHCGYALMGQPECPECGWRVGFRTGRG